jgi:hypothetical protein
MTEIQNPKPGPPIRDSVSVIPIRCLGFVSDFEFRASGFLLPSFPALV